MWLEWLVRIKNALDLMEDRMQQPLNIDEIAKAAYSSPFHFQRMFYMLTGVTVAEYVRKRRLTLAAQELSLSTTKVLDVAFKYGYDSPESFSKAFRKVHGISPSEARNPGVNLKAFPRITFHLSLKGDQEMDYKIVEKAAFTVIGKSIQVTTKNGENLREIPKFWDRLNADGTSDRIHALGTGDDILGICLDMKHGEETFSYLIAAEGNEDVAASNGLEARTIPAATWAVFTSTGPMPHSIQKVWQRIYQEWFPASNYEHSGGPELEVYTMGDAHAEDYRSEVWIPITKK
ncbi:AraC family transcriptional regulator [Paenibacillus polymyxa]|jgi:AraC family transcriptional regulator|uniref:AraC family transcriptional regulator n=1 Tax=Paenibacillus polymyxa TaxID=1406 RepID=UPI002ECFEF31|nr:GyrI-like domain-containing protein [Paenibacillus polymyxa]